MVTLLPPNTTLVVLEWNSFHFSAGNNRTTNVSFSRDNLTIFFTMQKKSGKPYTSVLKYVLKYKVFKYNLLRALSTDILGTNT